MSNGVRPFYHVTRRTPWVSTYFRTFAHLLIYCPGRCYTREVLEAYMGFCQKHNLHLITDESYALST
ncbi:hypothetical protein ASPVEDRAFT_441231 [Aspergillus versicolor CBS 583.65]|uniref:Aminotransferase class I/classII domain-containing protein n=1 Tax=Aspergillus versicolor CBS 583.65 TaxID=1036611 RepID=A0A1L9P938_ASPVE|nr:uncharacterized protein ASPVEDRAFT_441231 [Aspergillus versicolor CBS 583.65]OJI98039.1 hypothetical protein ASPVEDRAFT_441231 [Aspergillus versicolor CBS 583.65]